MKNLFISLAIIIAAASIQANAQAIVFNKVLSDETFVSTLNQFNVSASSGLPAKIRAGYVQVRALGNQARSIGLTLYPAYSCPTGQFCTMMMPIPVNLQAPVSLVSADSCGTKTYVGVVNSRSNVGALVKITVIDNAGSVCPRNEMLPATEVIVESNGLTADQGSISTIFGNQLEIQSSNNGEI